MAKMIFKKYSKEEFIQTIKESTSICQVLRKLGIKEAGGNYSTAKLKIKKLGIDISHFTGSAWNKGQNLGPKRPIEEYLNNTYYIQSFKLKKRLIEEDYLEQKCNNCKNTEWLNTTIPLELHHKDGNVDNNNLDNLELLCPNCHALTDNFRGKNAKKK